MAYSSVRLVWEDYEYNHIASVDDCLNFMRKYPRSGHINSVDSIIDDLSNAIKKAMVDNPTEFDLATLQKFMYKYATSNNQSIQSAVNSVRARVYQILEEQEEREEQARQDSIRKEEEARKREEYEKYGTDANAWRTATSANSIAGYKEYIKRYPKGKHIELANKYIIDLEVQGVVNSGDYGHLPSSQKVSYGTGKYSTINIRSRCNQSITIMYSGVKSMKIVIAPYESRSIVLPSSTYKVVATSPGVRSFYGTENLTGGNYESEYYISTSRY